MRAIALDSTFYEPYNLLTLLEWRAGDIPAARAALARARAAAGGDFWLRQTVEGQMMVAAGEMAGARTVLRSLERDPRLAQRAWLLRSVGDVDASYAMFGRAIAARDPDALWILTSDPGLYPFHGEPRYQELLKRAGVARQTSR